MQTQGKRHLAAARRTAEEHGMWNASLGDELAQLLLGVLLTYYFFKLHCVISL